MGSSTVFPVAEQRGTASDQRRYPAPAVFEANRTRKQKVSAVDYSESAVVKGTSHFFSLFPIDANLSLALHCPLSLFTVSSSDSLRFPFAVYTIEKSSTKQHSSFWWPPSRDKSTVNPFTIVLNLEMGGVGINFPWKINDRKHIRLRRINKIYQFFREL